LPTFAAVEAAAERLRPVARRTPLFESEALNRIAGGRLLIKAEPLQRTGSFKFRGAYNAISRLEKGRPVVAFSSGNHAQGVAAAAALLGSRATIVMPADAPLIKRRHTEAWGAEIRLYDRYHEVREEIGAEIARTTGAALIKPYDHPDVIAGQGTVGLEIVAQAKEQGALPEAALICCGGGGLIAGAGLALKTLIPGIAIHSVEPENFDDTARSLAAGERLANTPGGNSICDALLAPMPGELTFALNRDQVTSSFAVSDGEVKAAMALAFEHLKVVVEPGGAVALAAALNRRIQTAGRTIAVVLSGGNVDPALFRDVLAEAT
jgi:threonine dehydratase